LPWVVSHIKKRIIRFFSLLFLVIVISCSPARHIEEGKYLLNKSTIKTDTKVIDKDEMKRYEKQTPNKKILGIIKFHLFLYNLASPQSNKFPSTWFRKIGQEPVIWDSTLINRTTEQFRILLENKGFYYAKVKDTVVLKRKRANVTYTAILNNPYRLNSIDYIFEDESMSEIVLKDTANRLIKVGDRFDKDVLQKERQRLEDLIKNHGYYKFSKEYIFFEARMSGKKDSVNLSVIIKENNYGDIDPITKIRRHFQYKIMHTYLYPNYNFNASLRETEGTKSDTLRYNNYFLIYSGKHTIKPDALIVRNMCLPDNLYTIKDVKKTYDNYIALGLFRVVNVYFKEPGDESADTSEYKYINCFIELTPRKTQSYHIEIVGTNSAGDFGGRGNISFDNYNFLHGAEHFQIKFTGAIEQVKNRLGTKYSPLKELGVEPSLTLPVFIVPFNAHKFVRKFNPKTIINISYNYQDHPYYIRTTASTSFGYQWKGNYNNRHTLNPFNFSYVRLPKGITDATFAAEIYNTPLETSYTSHAIVAASYQYEFSNQEIEKVKNFVFIRYNVESAGLLTKGILQLTNAQDQDSIFGVNYFQYLKSDIDIRLNKQINALNWIVYRIFVGAGYAYGNSYVLPFEKMYYSGGPYGIRAWSTGKLGPGSAPHNDTIINNLGDIKLEGNLEYRFLLFWKLGGALFIDAGNIWSMQKSSSDPRATFKWDKFYKDIAVGTGFGLRIDWSFLLIRFDFGFRMRDPSIQTGSKWIDWNSEYKNNSKFIDRWTVQFGIGYPF
jgi:outer membrane protein assembly factor BamA